MTRKESLYKTAKTKVSVWGVPADTYVAVEYAFDRLNHLTNQHEPIYLIRATNDGPILGHVFGPRALTDFCL